MFDFRVICLIYLSGFSSNLREAIMREDLDEVNQRLFKIQMDL